MPNNPFGKVAGHLASSALGALSASQQPKSTPIQTGQQEGFFSSIIKPATTAWQNSFSAQKERAKEYLKNYQEYIESKEDIENEGVHPVIPVQQVNPTQPAPQQATLPKRERLTTTKENPVLAKKRQKKEEREKKMYAPVTIKPLRNLKISVVRKQRKSKKQKKAKKGKQVFLRKKK